MPISSESPQKSKSEVDKIFNNSVGRCLLALPMNVKMFEIYHDSETDVAPKCCCRFILSYYGNANHLHNGHALVCYP